MTKLYVNNTSRLQKHSCRLRTAGWLLLLVLLCNQYSFGQRFYADTEQHSAKQEITLLGLLGLLTISEVKNSTNASTLPTSDSSQLISNLGTNLLGLQVGTAWQNLQFASKKPSSNSPIYFKTKSQGIQILSLFQGFSAQRTNNGNEIGTSYSGTQLLGLLGLLGNQNDSTYLFIPPKADTSQFDGVKLEISALLGVARTANVYYAFFITTPIISADTETLCEKALADSVTLNLGNTGETGITYYLFKDTTGLYYSPGSNLNTATTGYVGTFSNHKITIANPFLTMGTGNKTQNYYIIAQDNANSPAFFYSAWEKITYKRTIQPAPGQASVTIN